MTSPTINVTPLIDVLLVLLIIFMVVAPLKPSAFKARIPNEPKITGEVNPNPKTLVATLEADGSLRLNKESGFGTIDDPGKLIDSLKDVFAERVENDDISAAFADEPGRPTPDRVERTVFIRAPRSTGYGQVAKLVDAVKTAGAFPISLQIDDLQ